MRRICCDKADPSNDNAKVSRDTIDDTEIIRAEACFCDGDLWVIISEIIIMVPLMLSPRLAHSQWQ